MLRSQLVQLFAQYRPLAPKRWRDAPLVGGEMPLPPADALRLADNLEALGVVIMGLDGWYYADGLRYLNRDKALVVQDLTVDFYVGDEVVYGNDPVQQSVAVIKDYITNHLPKTTPLVSFILDIPPWDLSAE